MNICYCNVCGKKFNLEDYEAGGNIFDNASGSNNFDLCMICYDKLLNSLIPNCKIKPFEEEK